MATTVHCTLDYRILDPHSYVVWEGDVRSGGDTWHYLLPMRADGPIWSVDIDIPELREVAETITLTYNYSIRRGDTVLRYEAPTPHTLSFSLTGEIQVSDRWIDPSPVHKLIHSPLAKLFGYGRDTDDTPIYIDSDCPGLITCHHPMVGQGDLLLSGSGEDLGGWCTDRAIALDRCKGTYHFAPYEGSEEYKFVLRLPDGNILWEEGENRKMPLPKEVKGIIAVEPPRFNLPNSPALSPKSGTVLPLFSLRSRDSYGIGDYNDALLFLKWLHRSGQSIYQLLPLNDTTFTGTTADSYPYNSITTYGLHPINLCVAQLPYYADAPDRLRWEQLAHALNEESEVKYVEVLRLKWEVIHHCFDFWYRAKGYQESGYEAYVERERADLIPYALFCTLRDRYSGKSVSDYPPFDECMREWESLRSIAGVSAEREVHLHSFVQYHLRLQADRLKSTAEAFGILLKGDLQIGVGRNSVEAWRAPHLYNLDMDAGAPPDAFSERGQVWGFPTYDWDAMRREGYAWWQHRFSVMSCLFDAIRIDHILGFFRIWSVPVDEPDPCLGRFVPALGYTVEDLSRNGLYNLDALSRSGDPDRLFVRDEDSTFHPRIMISRSPLFARQDEQVRQTLMRLHDEYFYHRNEELWRQTALERLHSLISSSSMLLCAEDLGMLPRSVSEVLRDFEILSLEVLRMPKREGQYITRKVDIPQLSVLTTSTHDMATLRGWWQTLSHEERVELRQEYGGDGELTPQRLIEALGSTSALLVILPLQDWCVLTGYGDEVAPDAERINQPEVSGHVWSYRMFGTVEDLLAHDTLIDRIRDLYGCPYTHIPPSV